MSEFNEGLERGIALETAQRRLDLPTRTADTPAMLLPEPSEGS